MRRTWLRGRENVHKRYLIHVTGYNLGLIMRLLTGARTPRGFRARVSIWFGAMPTGHDGCILLLVAASADQIAVLTVSLRPNPVTLPSARHAASTTRWNGVFQNSEVVIHVVRRSRGAGVVAEMLNGHRPAFWVS